MIVKLQGGLGNQLFQYAYGRTESLEANDVLFFDKSGLNGHPPRRYGLGDYNINVQFAEGDSLNGYWQSEKYFDNDLIRKELERPKGEPNAGCRKLALSIDNKCCFIGVRRSDYLWPERIGFHGVLPLSYYHEAMEHMPEGTKYYIFTDDTAWCLENFKYPIVYVNNPDEKHWDIWLMSLFSFAIIANSTFHWWGAWLSDGTVIAPKKWFVNQDTEIIPRRWKTL